MVCLQVLFQRLPSLWERIDFLLFSILLMATQKCSLTRKIFRKKRKGFHCRAADVEDGGRRPLQCCDFSAENKSKAGSQENQKGKACKNNWIIKSPDLYLILKQTAAENTFSRVILTKSVVLSVTEGTKKELWKVQLLCRKSLKTSTELISLLDSINPFIISAISCLRF